MKYVIENPGAKVENIYKEWALTNGLGGYAGNSILGVPCRTHQGLLIASLHAPVERYVVFSNVCEAFVKGEQTDSFYGASNLKRFIYDGVVTYEYETADFVMTKTISLVHGKNQAAVAYEIENRGESGNFVITPMMTFREHSQNATVDSLSNAFETVEAFSDVSGFFMVPKERKDLTISLVLSEGVQKENGNFKKDIPLPFEQDNEVEGLETQYMPYDFIIPVAEGQKKRISLICTASLNGKMQDASLDAFSIAEGSKLRVENLIKQSGYEKDAFADPLVAAADQFVVYRESTGLSTVMAGLPWFTDWGRDTMIAFTGLTLVTRRFEEARAILQTFAKYIHNGMVPNMFPDDGQEPLYNTVDASLWYFYAVNQYLSYVDTKEAYDFVQNEIYPGLKEIRKAYEAGTDFSIYMEEDGLLHAGGGFDQVTWMDVRVGEWVVTPRHGKPVEINALWYNALKIMEKLSNIFGDEEESSHCGILSKKTKESFCEKFWYEEGGYLYDVIDGEDKDKSLRPNQIYAVSLPYSLLPREKERRVVDVVEKELFVGVGLRSLSRDHKDYHGIYLGSLPKRDGAYHQGTAWGFLTGGFVTAYVKTHLEETTEDGKNPKATPELREQIMSMLLPLKEHLEENCIGSICEIFDGDKPHKGRGCYAQAWSVGEALRCYAENL